MIATTRPVGKKRPARQSLATASPRRSTKRSPVLSERQRKRQQERAQQLAEQVIDYMPNEDFLQLELDALPPLEAEPRSASTHRLRDQQGVGAYMASLYETPLLTREQEVDYFRRMNFLKFLAATKQSRIDVDQPDVTLLDEIERLIREAAEVRDRIIRANLRLVVSIAKRFVSVGHTFQDLVSDGHLSLMRAVEKFDFALGFRFSTYATWAIRKNFGRLIQRQRQNRTRFVPTEDQFFLMHSDPRDTQRSESRLNDICNVLKRLLHHLPDRERTIVHLRYGLHDAGHPHTLQEIATDMGVCKERVRQLELRALRKLQALAVNEKVEPPGGDL